MGLTLYWSLKSAASKPRPVRQALELLRQQALDLPFAAVSELVEFSGAAADFNSHPCAHPAHWLLIQAGQHVNCDGRSFHVSPRHVLGFSVIPGAGCEQANFGLCRYPAYVAVPGAEACVLGEGLVRPRQRVATGLGHWKWTSFCKTKYASDPKSGGLENFLRCHLSLIALLIHARELKLLDQVQDEGGYWEKRDIRALAQRVGRWKEMTADFCGQREDQVSGQEADAASTRLPKIEHLEGKGRAR